MLYGRVMSNQVHHTDNLLGMAKLPEKCAQLIIADPPYFEVKGEFDFVYKDFAEYLDFMEDQAKAYKRILAENGTLFVYGHAKKIAYVQVIFDKYFGLVNCLVWEKAERDGLFGATGSEQLRSFPNATERILMYSGNDIGTGAEQAIRQSWIWAPLKEYFVQEFKKSGLTIKAANEIMGYATTGSNVAGGLFLSKKKDFVFPVKKAWHFLQKTGFFQKSYSLITREYEECKKIANNEAIKFEELRRPFNNYTKNTEVLKFRFKPSKHDHDTVKPDSLCNALINTCSRKGDLVVIPFAGSGSECVAAKKAGRDFIGFELNEKYVKMARERVRLETAQLQLW